MASESVSADLTLCFFAGEESEGGAARFVEVLKTILVCEEGTGNGFEGVWVTGVCYMCPWGLSVLNLRSSVAFRQHADPSHRGTAGKIGRRTVTPKSFARQQIVVRP
jgi:hypothetical protein